MADNTLDQMAKVDFSAPLNTMMLLEITSDDEHCSSAKKQKLTPAIQKEIVQESDNDSTKTENHLQKTKTNSCNCECNFSDKEKTSKTASRRSSVTEETTHISASNEDEQQTRSDKTIRPPDTVNLIKDSIGGKHEKSLDVMRLYLKKLMDNVSEHIIVILCAYNSYKRAEGTQNRQLIEYWKKHYIQIKHRFFSMCYVVVDTLLIPQNHCESFSSQFIENTRKIASKQEKQITKEQIKLLYTELLEWTRVESEKLKKYAQSYSTTQTQQNTTLTIENQQKANTQSIDKSSPNVRINLSPDTQKPTEKCNQSRPPCIIVMTYNPLQLTNKPENDINQGKSNGEQVKDDTASIIQQLNTICDSLRQSNNSNIICRTNGPRTRQNKRKQSTCV